MDAAVATRDLLLVRLIAKLLDAALGRSSDRVFAEHLIDLHEHREGAALQEALRTLYAYYVALPAVDSFIYIGIRRRMRRSLLEVASSFPMRLRKRCQIDVVVTLRIAVLPSSPTPTKALSQMSSSAPTMNRV